MKFRITTVTIVNNENTPLMKKINSKTVLQIPYFKQVLILQVNSFALKH